MWKQEAKELYIKGEKIQAIATAVNISRRTLGDYFKSLPTEIQNERKGIKKELRKEYQNNWDKTERNRGQDITYALMRRQHDIDVRVLSAECHF